MSVKTLEFKIKPEMRLMLKDNPWAEVILEFAKDEKGQEYMRKRGSLIIYQLNKKNNSLTYSCIKCGSELLSQEIPHPVWDKENKSFDYTKCCVENAPYCPLCEKIIEHVGEKLII